MTTIFFMGNTAASFRSSFISHQSPVKIGWFYWLGSGA